MITTESTMRIVWFRPSMIERRASGSCTLVRICRFVAPVDRAASMVSGGTSRIPSAVSRMPGGSA